ncbi:MAG: hypothetical protein HBSAPP03_29830 [Phycisphaerae bacterium]|nr:MAG: hypothetical protein HBSAPP03_29830 [Phycisphaerae bacterium]
MTTTEYALSPLARARMEHDLPALRARVARRGRVRRWSRRAITAGAIAAVISLAWVALRPLPVSSPPPNPPRDAPLTVNPTPHPMRTVIAGVEVLTNDPSITRRLAATVIPAATPLDDGALQDTLAKSGQPHGLLRVGGRTYWEGDLALASKP